MFIIIFMNPAEFSSRHELIVNENLLNDASRNLDITNRLYRQWIENTQRVQLNMEQITYNRFPIGHPGHLDLNRQIRLVEILENNLLTNQKYRFGSSIGSIYIRRTYSSPVVDTMMIAAVYNHEYNQT